MKASNIVKKILLYAALGIVVFLAIELIFDWEGFNQDFKEGYNGAVIDLDEKQSTGFKEMLIKSADGLDIKADIYDLEDATSPLILLFHQAGYSRGEYREIAPKLNTLGFSCIAIDQRSGREVNGVVNEAFKQATEAGLKTNYIDALPDLQACLKYAIEHYPSRKIILWGSSYSSSLVFILGSEYKDKVSAILSFSPGEYFSYEDKEIKAFAKEVDCPVFITSAKNEQDAWELIFEAIPSTDKAYFLPEQKGFHGSRALWEKNEGNEFYWEAVTAFLAKIK